MITCICMFISNPECGLHLSYGWYCRQGFHWKDQKINTNFCLKVKYSLYIQSSRDWGKVALMLKLEAGTHRIIQSVRRLYTAQDRACWLNCEMKSFNSLGYRRQDCRRYRIRQRLIRWSLLRYCARSYSEYWTSKTTERWSDLSSVPWVR